MYRFYTVIAVVLCMATSSKAQIANDAFYVFKSDWSPAKNLDGATYFMQVVAENDTTYYCRYYQKFGPMVKQECYKDSNLEVPNGLFIWYDKKGRMDSSGYVYQQKKDGNWQYFDDSMKVILSEDYEQGKFIKRQNWMTKKIMYADGRYESYDTVANKTDTEKIFKVVQVEAKFKDGAQGWLHYLLNNLQIPDRLVQLNKSGTVVVGFDVDTVGNISRTMIVQSFEWSADAEAIRVIKNGPKWVPAMQNGRLVRFRQRQAITMKVN